MIRLCKYLKESIPAIIAVVVLLFMQAYCDLTLPEFTSDIVNVGIQQNGVDSLSPKLMSKQTYDAISMFMTEEEKKSLNDGYEEVKVSDVTKQEEDLYEKLSDMKADDIVYRRIAKKDDLENLEQDMEMPMIILSLTDGTLKEKMKQYESTASSDFGAQMGQGMKPGPDGKMDFTAIREQLKKVPDMMVSQCAVMRAQVEYENLGVDIKAMQMKYLFISGMKMIAFALLSMAVAIMVALLSSRIAAKFARKVRNVTFGKVLAFSHKEFNDFSTASLITRSTNDVQQVQLLMVMVFRMVLFAPILGIGGIIKVLQTDASMTWIIGLAVGVIAIVVITLFIVVMPKFRSLQKLIDKLNLVTREILTGLLVIRSFHNEKKEEKRFEEANINLTKTNLFVNRVMTIMMPTMMLIMNGVSVLILYKGSYSINDGNMQVGNLMAFIQYAMQIIMSFLMISMISIMLPRAAASGERIQEILDCDVAVKEKDETKALEQDKRGYVEFKNVSYAYDEAEESVLSNINFVAKPGETTAIIGSTGCGKSTLVNLIPRFYDATDGEILVDGVNVKDLSLKDLRDEIGYVPQKAMLFSGTIASNMRFGNHNATEQELQHAASIAQAEEFIADKAEKFDAPISQGGSNVSGGQKQRLSIARAIAKDPKIYIFDDSFSALDYKTDAKLRQDLSKETKESTVIIVAQRISTIAHADQILVLDDGEIVGKGTHNELMKNCEVYQQIASTQLTEKELENYKA